MLCQLNGVNIEPRLNKSKIGFNWTGGVNTFDPQITQITQK